MHIAVIDQGESDLPPIALPFSDHATALEFVKLWNEMIWDGPKEADWRSSPVVVPATNPITALSDLKEEIADLKEDMG